ncbi:transcription antitermination protein NusG [compost metagenome]
MGAAFAIQVMTGKELNVKKLMEWAFSKSETAQNWIKAIHTLTESTFRILNDGSRGKEIQRAVMPGYIFLEMNYSVENTNQSAYIPADVWHLIKSIPGVIKQFTNSGQIIGSEEFQSMLGLDMEEKVEVTVPVQEVAPQSETAQVRENEHQVKEALHQMNMASTEDERTAAEQALEVAEQQMNQMMEVEFEEDKGSVGTELKKVKNTGLLSKIKALVRGGKEYIRFPKVMLDTIILQENKHDNPTPAVIIALLMNYIRHLGKS